MKYGDLTLGQIEALVNKLGGLDMVEQILRRDSLAKEVAKLAVNGQTLTARVRYGDREHYCLVRDQYLYIASPLSKKDFPVRGMGVAEVTYEYITFDDSPTTQQVLDEIEYRADVRLPDFAETRDFLTQNPQEQNKNWIVSLCGKVASRFGALTVAHVRANDKGRMSLNHCWLTSLWVDSPRFLVVRKNSITC